MRWLRGLRARLVITFVLVGGLSAVAAAGLTYYKARENLLAGVQDTLFDDFRNRVLPLSREVALPADEDELNRLAEDLEVGDREVYVVKDEAVPSDTRITAELRAAVARKPELMWQRVTRDGLPYLVGGSRVMLNAGGAPSGITVYLVESLGQAATGERAVRQAARTAALPVILLAVLAGLLAARQVLWPVSDLMEISRFDAGAAVLNLNEVDVGAASPPACGPEGGATRYGRACPPVSSCRSTPAAWT